MKLQAEIFTLGFATFGAVLNLEIHQVLVLRHGVVSLTKYNTVLSSTDRHLLFRPLLNFCNSLLD